MNAQQKLQLKNMVQANNALDQTSLIRSLKHSDLFREEIATMLQIKTNYKQGQMDAEMFNLECMQECNFMFTYYTEIYNKIKNDQLDLNVFYKFLDVLKKIENNEIDQHEGSFEIGSMMKKIFIDDVLKLEEPSVEGAKNEKNEKVKREKKNISWREFKKTTLR